MSAQKMREVVRQIQGSAGAHAQAVLAVVPRKGARVVAKTLKSAMANAEDLKMHKAEYQDFKTENLRVKSPSPAPRRPSNGSSQGARFGRPDPQAQLPRQNCFVRRIILWVKKQIQSVFASPSTRTGAPSGSPRRKISANCWPKTARSASSSRRSWKAPPFQDSHRTRGLPLPHHHFHRASRRRHRPQRRGDRQAQGRNQQDDRQGSLC